MLQVREHRHRDSRRRSCWTRRTGASRPQRPGRAAASRWNRAANPRQPVTGRCVLGGPRRGRGRGSGGGGSRRWEPAGRGPSGTGATSSSSSTASRSTTGTVAWLGGAGLEALNDWTSGDGRHPPPDVVLSGQLERGDGVVAVRLLGPPGELLGERRVDGGVGVEGDGAGGGGSRGSRSRLVEDRLALAPVVTSSTASRSTRGVSAGLEEGSARMRWWRVKGWEPAGRGPSGTGATSSVHRRQAARLGTAGGVCWTRRTGAS